MQVIINGKTVGIKFNNYALEQLLKIKGLENTQFGFVYGLCYSGYLGWKFIRENMPLFVDPELTFEDVVDWVDKAGSDATVAETVTLITDEYHQSQLYLKSIEKKSELPILT